MVTKTIDKSVKTPLEIERAICDITERTYEKYLSNDEVLKELLYEKEILENDIENKNYINEAHKVSLNNQIKKLDGEITSYQESKKDEVKTEVERIIKAGGLVVGKQDRTIKNWHIKKFKNKIPYPSCSKRKVEDIYYVKDDMHSLTIGATRSR